MNIFRTFIYIYMFAIFFVLPCMASAANIEVDTASDISTSGDSSCSLREAIVNANGDSDSSGGDCAAGSGADHITFASNYTITLTSALPDITTDITIDGQGAANTIVQASTCDPVTLPGGCTPADWRVFTFTAGSSTVKDMTVRYGNCDDSATCSGSGSYKTYGGNIFAGAGSTSLMLDGVHVQSGNAYDYGGGISLWGGDLTIQNNSLVGGVGTGNSSSHGDGGGVYFNSGVNLTIDNSKVSYNNTIDFGGGVYFEDGNSVTIRNGSLIDHNNNTGGSDGGGLFASGGLTCQLTIDSSIISNSLIVNGGWGSGLYTGCDSTINASTISGNTAEDATGGGIFINTSTNVTITNSTIANNQTTNSSGIPSGLGRNGGGIFNRGTLTVVNSTLYNNDSYENGGGLYNRSGATATLINTTFSDHNAVSGDSIYNAGTLHLSNTIIANNAGSNCFNDAGTVATNINNLIEGTAPIGNECGTPAFTADPLLGPLASNGGPTQTMALLAGSPAIDAGNETVCADTNTVNNLDQRGVRRPTACDIGAYEVKIFPWTMFLPAMFGKSD